ncbi:hypothetical protein A11A3_13785 [Alcanivorax hongdengensis A-11-3]|uniref:Outer membrane protein beta-barrel domain-containing protein n=1 Tax=Alcanivorax hongdengensis A-11-3 TaxID=1177179 RepID=L0W9L7_9GAMM|nr:outer membrane beta-barrel protein [Alcanivorax hongdengensis]EKF73428.1 hypothetical protein A11A3_13785 [Alcanivorax hongdengensis A-11-3]
MRYLILVGLLISPSLWADSIAHYQDRRNAYVGGSLMAMKLEYDDGAVNPAGVNVRLGGMLDEHWGVELRAGVGPSPDTWRGNNGRKVDYTLDHVGALLLTGRLPFQSPVALPRIDSLFVQGFAGLADTKVKTDRRYCNAGVCRSDVERNDDTTFAWGVGAGLRTEYNIGLTLQYMHYTTREYIDITSVEGGLEWYF